MAETETETTPLLLPAGAGVTGIVDPAVARPPPGDQQETENPNRPTGLRFAIVYISILLGDFFVGYVCSNPKPGVINYLQIIKLDILGHKLCNNLDASYQR